MDPDLKLAQEAARRAGDVVMSYFRDEYEIRDKGEGNPVTTADLEADSLLKEVLLGARPDDGCWVITRKGSTSPIRW